MTDTKTARPQDSKPVAQTQLGLAYTLVAQVSLAQALKVMT